MADIEIRAAHSGDLARLERKCWAGGEAEMRERMAAQGTCAIVALDDGVPVGQLYLRAYRPGFRAEKGLWEGAFWADLNGVEDRVELPERTLMLGCWHVGRVRDADGAEREAPEYRGRGIGKALLEGAVAWLGAQDRFTALAAKATDSEDRGYIGFVGGLPLSAFTEAGFERLASYDDPCFLADPGVVPESAVAEHPARFHLVLRRA